MQHLMEKKDRETTNVNGIELRKLTLNSEISKRKIQIIPNFTSVFCNLLN